MDAVAKMDASKMEIEQGKPNPTLYQPLRLSLPNKGRMWPLYLRILPFILPSIPTTPPPIAPVPPEFKVTLTLSTA